MAQQELAKKLNTTDRTISHWENGRKFNSYEKTIVKQ